MHSFATVIFVNVFVSMLLPEGWKICLQEYMPNIDTLISPIPFPYKYVSQHASGDQTFIDSIINIHISTYIIISIPVNVFIRRKVRYVSVTYMSSQSSSSSSSTLCSNSPKRKSALAGRCRECEFLMWGSFNLLIWPGLGACLFIWKPNLCLGVLHGLLQRCGQRISCICALQCRY